MNYYRLIFLLFVSIGCTEKIEDPALQKPTNLNYEESVGIVKTGKLFQSVVPTIEGAEPLVFSVGQVVDKLTNEAISDNSDISINESNGVIELVSGNSLVVGTYSIDVVVSNSVDDVTFLNAFTISIVELEIPKGLVYNPNSISIEEGVNFVSVSPSVDGLIPITYNIKNSADLGDFISIETSTGVVSVDGSKSVIGDFSLDIEVSNGDGVALFLQIFTIAITQHTVSVSDGFYITLDAEDPAQEGELMSSRVNAQSFSSMTRSGFMQGYVYLTAGNYNIVEVSQSIVVNTYAGSSSIAANNSIDDECDASGYNIVTSSSNGSAFSVGSDGLYVVTYDAALNEIVYDEISSVGIIGSSTEGGWGSDTDLSGSVDVSGGLWEITGVVLEIGQVRFRHNCRWAIDRRLDMDAAYDNSNGYSFTTHYGGSFSQLIAGNEGDPIPITERAEYTVSFSWDPNSGVSSILTRTGDAPEIVFDPSEYQWGIIGGAISTGSWNDDIDLAYSDLVGVTHSWAGSYDLSADDFKFRTNDSWDVNLGYNDATLSGDLVDLSDSGGNFNLSAGGNYTITISTSDDGGSWNIDFKKN